jgi:hypothetical protein
VKENERREDLQDLKIGQERNRFARIPLIRKNQFQEPVWSCGHNFLVEALQHLNVVKQPEYCTGFALLDCYELFA